MLLLAHRNRASESFPWMYGSGVRVPVAGGEYSIRLRSDRLPGCQKLVPKAQGRQSPPSMVHLSFIRRRMRFSNICYTSSDTWALRPAQGLMAS